MSDSVRPHRGSPPGSPVPGILQARTLEWVAISFSNAWKWKWSRFRLSDPMDCSLSGSSAYGIFQARVLEWVAITFSERSLAPFKWQIQALRSFQEVSCSQCKLRSHNLLLTDKYNSLNSPIRKHDFFPQNNSLRGSADTASQGVLHFYFWFYIFIFSVCGHMVTMSVGSC